ncbi:hypothetical protein [Nonomuraea sp. GTA35]|uniref:hypothetical protein n=1 Tax=Nonomuraea sp. GTA35 TaxID=1676746 RepID=UPI0035C1DD43
MTLSSAVLVDDAFDVVNRCLFRVSAIQDNSALFYGDLLGQYSDPSTIECFPTCLAEPKDKDGLGEPACEKRAAA